MRDADTDLLHEMATYAPKETEPFYQLVALSAHSGCAACDGATQVQILFKRALYPLVNDTDILPIQNLEALKFQLMSIKKMEAGDSKNAFADTALAVKEMNLQDAEEQPDDNIPVSVQPFGSAGLKRHRIGSCI
jgi:hypothetical protein